jgi:hypothetical protein
VDVGPGILGFRAEDSGLQSKGLESGVESLEFRVDG